MDTATKKQELRAAQAFLTGRLGQTVARGTALVEVIVLPDHRAAVYYGLVHTETGVYAVVRFAHDSFLDLVHHSNLCLAPNARLSENTCQCEEPVRVVGNILCGECKRTLPALPTERWKVQEGEEA